MSPRTLFTSEYCTPGHYSPVNNVPLVYVLICKFVALQLVVEIMHGPSLASHTSPTLAQITFSITHGSYLDPYAVASN